MIDKQLVLDSIRKAQADGWIVSDGRWVSSIHKRCCPLAACVWAKGISEYDFKMLGLRNEAAAILGITVDSVDAFTMGFDGCTNIAYQSVEENDAYTIGCEIRKELGL